MLISLRPPWSSFRLPARCRSPRWTVDSGRRWPARLAPRHISRARPSVWAERALNHYLPNSCAHLREKRGAGPLHPTPVGPLGRFRPRKKSSQTQGLLLGSFRDLGEAIWGGRGVARESARCSPGPCKSQEVAGDSRYVRDAINSRQTPVFFQVQGQAVWVPLGPSLLPAPPTHSAACQAQGFVPSRHRVLDAAGPPAQPPVASTPATCAFATP